MLRLYLRLLWTALRVAGYAVLVLAFGWPLHALYLDVAWDLSLLGHRLLAEMDMLRTEAEIAFYRWRDDDDP